MKFKVIQQEGNNTYYIMQGVKGTDKKCSWVNLWDSAKIYDDVNKAEREMYHFHGDYVVNEKGEKIKHNIKEEI